MPRRARDDAQTTYVFKSGEWRVKQPFINWATGATRFVLFVGPWALKFPRFPPWRCTLQGMLANMQEALWSGSSFKLCPIRFSLPGGFLVVMDRCQWLTETDLETFEAKSGPIESWAYDKSLDIMLPIEPKACSWGIHPKLGLVAVDYGS